MTKTTTQAADLIGTRVEAGTGDDYDTGTVQAVIDEQTVLVAWDSGVKTPAAISQLTAI